MSVVDLFSAASAGTAIVSSNEKNGVVVSTLALSVIVEDASVALRIDSFSVINHIDVEALKPLSCVILGSWVTAVRCPGSAYYRICAVNVLPGASKGGAYIVHPLSHDATV